MQISCSPWSHLHPLKIDGKKKVGIKIARIKIARQNRKRKMQQKVKSKTPPNLTDSKQ